MTLFGRKHPPSEMAAVGHSVRLFVCCGSCLIIEFSAPRPPKNKNPCSSSIRAWVWVFLRASAYIVLTMPGVVGSIPCFNEMG